MKNFFFWSTVWPWFPAVGMILIPIQMFMSCLSFIPSFSPGRCLVQGSGAALVPSSCPAEETGMLEEGLAVRAVPTPGLENKGAKKIREGASCFWPNSSMGRVPKVRAGQVTQEKYREAILSKHSEAGLGKPKPTWSWIRRAVWRATRTAATSKAAGLYW